MKYEIKQINDTDAVVIGTGREEIKENTNTFKEGFNGDWFWCAKYNKIANNGDITAFDFKVIATISPFKIEGLPMLELPTNRKLALQWWKNLSTWYLKSEMMKKHGYDPKLVAEDINLHPDDIEIIYNLELPNQEDDVEKLLEPFILDNGHLYCHNTPFLIKKLKAAQKQYSEEDMRKAFETGRNYQLTGENNFNELLQSLQKKQFPIAVELEIEQEYTDGVTDGGRIRRFYGKEDFKIIKWYYE